MGSCTGGYVVVGDEEVDVVRVVVVDELVVVVVTGFLSESNDTVAKTRPFLLI